MTKEIIRLGEILFDLIWVDFLIGLVENQGPVATLDRKSFKSGEEIDPLRIKEISHPLLVITLYEKHSRELWIIFELNISDAQNAD